MKRIFFVSLGFFFFGQAISQATANAELKNLINKSFEYFPKVKEVENTVLTAEAKMDFIKLNSQPTVSGSAGYNYVWPVAKVTFPQNGVDKTLQFQPNHNYDVAANANYILFDFGRQKAEIEKAKTDVEFAKDNALYLRTQLAYNVAVIYYNIIYYQKSIVIEDSVIAYLSEQQRITESKLKNGDAIKIDLLNIESSKDNEQNRKEDLQNNLEKQKNLLEYTTGITSAGDNDFDFNMNIKTLSDAVSEASTNNLDFKIAKDKIAQAQSDISITKLQSKPNVNLNAGLGFRNGYVPQIYDFKFNYSGGISFSVPIYGGGRSKQQIKLQETIVKQNELYEATLNSTYKKDISQALIDINTNLERIKNSEGQIQEANTAAVLAASRFKNGVGTNLEITNAGTNVQRAAFTKLQYQYQLCLAKLELARLTGNVYW